MRAAGICLLLSAPLLGVLGGMHLAAAQYRPLAGYASPNLALLAEQLPAPERLADRLVPKRLAPQQPNAAVERWIGILLLLAALAALAAAAMALMRRARRWVVRIASGVLAASAAGMVAVGGSLIGGVSAGLLLVSLGLTVMARRRGDKGCV